MEVTSSYTGRKVYPKCTCITREYAVTNILNWLDDKNKGALSSSDQETEDENEEISTSSESEYAENESTISIEEVVPNESKPWNNTNSDYENTEVEIKKQRGCPKGSSTANKNQQKEQPYGKVAEWNEVVDHNDLRLHEFRYIPAKKPLSSG